MATMIKIRRVENAPRIHLMVNELGKFEFDRNKDEFTIPYENLAIILRDGNMEVPEGEEPFFVEEDGLLTKEKEPDEGF